ncbi:MAG: NAD(P)/FAD-dependent oxidoreductase [Candidatus Methylopumilus sp.]|nr:NAD(P)/FAD-dependent oxidoreductase [Candidatus Methylopumilus sp.]
MTTVNRRSFLTRSLAGAGTLVASGSVLAQPLLSSPKTALLAPTGKRRVVIAGGGWGGLSAAKHLRALAPDLEVIVLEKNPIFWSCPMSNKWLVNAVDTDLLAHSYIIPAKKYGYTFVQTEITDIDRSAKTVYTADGFIKYDWLIIAGGIRYAFEAWFGNDQKTIQYTKTNYASAYIPSSEHAFLKNKIQNFKGGTIVMTLPPPPHRCPPSPYERACLMAWWFKEKKIPAKIIILDPKPRIAPITIGYQKAFTELYSDIITHVPNATVKEVDPYNKIVKTAAGDFKFDEAILMSPHQAADLVWKADLIGKDKAGKPTGWAAVDPQYYNTESDPQVFVIGDSVGSVSIHFGHYPKSGHVANREARLVAKYIAAQAKGVEPKAEMIDNLCFMLVNNSPKEAISVSFSYTMGPDDEILQKAIDDNDRRPELWTEDLKWLGGMYADFL